MALNGIIDAAVNGGISKYQEAFFTPEYAEEHPENVETINALKEGMNEQVKLLEKGLELHSKLCPPNMRGMQEKLDCT
jgi:hypothetical protein